MKKSTNTITNPISWAFEEAAPPVGRVLLDDAKLDHTGHEQSGHIIKGSPVSLPTGYAND